MTECATNSTMLVSSSIIPAPRDPAAARYAVERFDYSKATARDQSQIGELYRAYFAHLGLVFDPSLDTDFVKPCAYYHHRCDDTDAGGVREGNGPNGAYFVVRRFDDGMESQGAATASPSSFIVGTIGVRAYTFPAVGADGTDTDYFHTFVAGMGEPSTKAAIASMSRASICELKRMIIHPECQGKGIGKQLLEAAQRWAFGVVTGGADAPLRPAGGYSAMVLDTKRWLAAANHLYERYGGFVDCGNYNGNYRADRFMVAVK